MTQDMSLNALFRQIGAAADSALSSPEEEALALRALVDQAFLSAPATVSLWRELMGERRRRSGAPPIAAAPAAAHLLLARQWGGAAAPYMTFDRAEAALDHARARGAPAVIGLGPRDGWWVRLLAEPELRVVAALGPLIAPAAFVVAQGRTGPTGDDETYFVTDAPIAPARLIESFGALGFACDLVQDVGGLKLVALAGYVQDEDGRLADAPGRLKGVIGSSPRFHS